MQRQSVKQPKKATKATKVATKTAKRNIKTTINKKKQLKQQKTAPVMKFSTEAPKLVQSVKPIAPNDQFRYDGKAVIITGGAAGIGRSTAVQLAKEKANLMLVDIDLAGLEATKAQCLEANPNSKIEVISANCSDEPSIINYVNKTISTFGRIDAAFINHGVEGPQHPMDSYPSEQFSRVLDINLTGVMHNLRHVLKFMKHEQQFGSVLITSSVAGHRAVDNMAGYVASKHGCIGLARAAALEYAQYNININALQPGAVKTQMVTNALTEMAKLQGTDLATVETAFAGNNPSKRMGVPQEVAYTAAFLMSHQASLINGVGLPLDGGQSYKY